MISGSVLQTLTIDRPLIGTTAIIPRRVGESNVRRIIKRGLRMSDHQAATRTRIKSRKGGVPSDQVIPSSPHWDGLPSDTVKVNPNMKGRKLMRIKRSRMIY